MAPSQLLMFTFLVMVLCSVVIKTCYFLLIPFLKSKCCTEMLSHYLTCSWPILCQSWLMSDCSVILLHCCLVHLSTAFQLRTSWMLVPTWWPIVLWYLSIFSTSQSKKLLHNKKWNVVLKCGLLSWLVVDLSCAKVG